MTDIFLSYSSKDRETAKALAGVLEQRGWRVWWDRRIPVGEEYADVIVRHLNEARCVVVLWSAASVESDWEQNEAADAKERRLLLPAMIEPVKIPFEFRRIQAADLVGWKGEPTHPGLSTLIDDLTARIGPPPTPPHDPPPTRPPDPRDEEIRPEETEEDSPPHAAPPKTYLPPIPPPAPPPPNRKLFIIGGVAVLALGALIYAFLPKGAPTRNVNRADVSPTVAASPSASASHASASPTPVTRPPTVNVNRNPLTVLDLNSERLRKLALLLQQINSPDQQVRRGKTAVLKAEYGSDPRAVEQSLALLDQSRVGELSPQGLINVLFFLNETDAAAWTPESVQKAEAAVALLETKELGAQAVDARDKLKARAAALRRAQR